MADIPWMVQVLAMRQHRLHETPELFDQSLTAGFAAHGVRCLPEHVGGQIHVFLRRAPGQHVARAGLDRAQVVRKQLRQPVPGPAQQFGVVGGFNPLPGSGKVGGQRSHVLCFISAECGVQARFHTGPI